MRARSDRDYVYDLYKTYLMREPDQQGWNNWTATVPTYGREQVRGGFEYSVEFMNLMATMAASGNITSGVSSLSSARVDPENQPGSGLLARDAEWSVPLLSLPGRAGLDLGLSLSYSSMVWTRSGPYIYFDEDNGFPSPGFQLGFPTIQEKVFDAQVGQNVYVLVTAAGTRVELRQVGSSNVYEAADLSYLQLIDNGSLLVRTTDGTQLSYGWFNQEYRCTEIKDRNGNYLTVNYDWRGDIANITDTLGRVITFNYDGNANLLSITQAWNGQTHTWASFGWGSPLSMQQSFSGVSVVGMHNGEAIPVLRQVGLDDGSYYTFEYTGAGQVNLIQRYSGDNVQRSYTAYDYTSPASDCPRLSQTRVSADNWTGVNGVPSEVATQFNEPGDGSHQVVAADGTVYKEFYGTGWQKGLTTQSEVWSGGVRQKWTTTSYTQDNTNVSYQTNPRVTETNVYDAPGNRRRSTISYNSVAVGATTCHLPETVREYAADAATVLRRTVTAYRWDSDYTTRRIIGLVGTTSGYGDDTESSLASKVEYHYDWAGHYTAQEPTVQHDTAYSASFTSGRGDLVGVLRYNKDAPADANQAIWVRFYGYDLAGSTLWAQRGPEVSHRTNFSYADSFSDGVNNRGTLAYPTTITDPDSNQSTVQYNFDTGAVTRQQDPKGAVVTKSYDSAARLVQVTTTNYGAYTRYVYGPNYVQSFGSVNSVADDAYSIQVFDGVGRVIGAAKNHPGSSGGYSAQTTIYDLMGRAMKQSNPAEINSGWAPTGEEAAGWLYTQQTYDWKGRPLVTINTDDTPSNPSRKQLSYSGCGCAGVEVVTVTDEVGRRQKVYRDVLGRPAKNEVLNWDSTIYSTTINTYNALDQVKSVRQYQGAESSGTYQETTMTYDGHGRLKTQHVPQQGAGAATTYNYNSDDTVSSVTDARGASATYSYNSRHLVTSIAYSAPAGITPTANVTFGYDAAGNRVSMTDGLGTQTYNYDQLSRMSSETRTFSGVGSYTINYQYNLANQLSSITDPFNKTISYTRDTAGRLSAITGTPFGTVSTPVSTYASNIQYRAWGVIKHLDYGDNKTLDATYNSRMLAASYTVPSMISKSYDYYADGRLRFSSDMLDHRFDRYYGFDHAGRLTEGFSGAEARFEPPTTNRPYKGTYSYDSFNHLSQSRLEIWGDGSAPVSDSYTNNRHDPVAGLWQYDADGRLLYGIPGRYTYDAAGHHATLEAAGTTAALGVDGNGQQIKTSETHLDEGSQNYITETKYFVRSSVLGNQVLTETDGDQSHRTFVYAGRAVLAWQQHFYSLDYVDWERRDPSGASVRFGGVQQELDPFGGDAGVSASGANSDPGPLLTYGGSYSSGGNVSYTVDGIRVTLDDFILRMGHVAADPFALLEASTAGSSRPVGTRKRGVRDGRQFDIIYDANGSIQSQWWGGYDELAHLDGDRTFSNSVYGSSAWRELAGLNPQNPGLPVVSEQKYNDCAKLLGNSPAPGYSQTAAIVGTSALEGTDPTLLAVTWSKEAIPPFNFSPVSNYRPEDGGWDVGPLQVSTTYYNKSPFTDGLPNPFGTVFSESQAFNGNSYSSLRVGARALNEIASRSRSRADTAGLYRAGSRKPASYRTRANEFNSLSKGYDAFFNCLKK